MKNIPREDAEKAVRVKKLQEPSQELDFSEWRDVIRKNFPDLVLSAEAGVSILSQLLIKDITNPFALVLIDVPASGKTIAVNFFSDVEELAYATDKFTPASFVSNAVNVRREQLPEIDLLPRLQYKLFIIRDLATLFSKRDDDLNECLGILTRVLDGEGLNTDSGIHGQRVYNGEYLFMILAASTPIPHKVWKMMGNLGSRLFFLSIGSQDKSDEELVNQLRNTPYKDKEVECRNATSDFLRGLWAKYPEGIEWDRENDPKEIMEVVARCARLLSRLRGSINVWIDELSGNSSGGSKSKYNYSTPIIEKPDRINQLFYNLCRGHALCDGRESISEDDLELILQISMDSAPTARAKLFKMLLEHGGSMTTSEVEQSLGCSKPTALREMKTLEILNICKITNEESEEWDVGRPEQQIHLCKEFEWFLSDQAQAMRKPRKANTSLLNKLTKTDAVAVEKK